jgi:hypothetical protein
MPEIDDNIKEQIFELHKDASIIKISPTLADVYEKVKLYNPNVQLVLDMGWSEDLSLETLQKYGFANTTRNSMPLGNISLRLAQQQ